MESAACLAASTTSLEWSFGSFATCARSWSVGMEGTVERALMAMSFFSSMRRPFKSPLFSRKMLSRNACAFGCSSRAMAPRIALRSPSGRCSKLSARAAASSVFTHHSGG